MNRIQNIHQHLTGCEVSVFRDHASSSADPSSFWKGPAQDIHWFVPPTKILDDSNAPFYKWFVGGQTNACYNAVDLHVEKGRGNQVAIIYDSPLANKKMKFTFAELKQKVSVVAGTLARFGVKKGDTVLIYMPMIPETLFAMLACARIGAVHSVVFGGFASKELSKRISDCTPKVILSASCGIEMKGPIAYKPLLNEAIDLSPHKPEKCLIYQREQLKCHLSIPRDYDWEIEISKSSPIACVPVESNHPLYVLYTSGTTGIPKGIVRDHGGYTVALKWSMSNIYSANTGEVFWAASDFGWVVGHSYIVYGPLIKGCTTIIYEGKPVGTPDPGAFWRVVNEHKVSVLFTAPTVLRTLKKEDPDGIYIKKYSLSGMKSMFLAGERSDPDSLTWANNLLRIPIIDHWWMTETGWPITSICMGIKKLQPKLGSAGPPVTGFNLMVVDDKGVQVKPDEFGNLVVKLPLPPGAMQTLWKNDKRYVSAYLSRFPGFFETGDAGYQDKDGFVYVMSRTDDLIQVAGHRLSTGGIEGTISEHPSIAEVAVVGVKDKIKGEKPLAFIVLKTGVTKSESQIIKETFSMVRETIGAFACYDKAYIVKRLPKTRSGKILRRSLRQIADGEKYEIPATIDDPLVLQEIEEVLKG